MYKVFIENITIKFLSTKDFISKNELVCYLSGEKESVKYLKKIVSSLAPFSILNVVCKNEHHVFKAFFKEFDKVEAAGGIVQRKNSYLFIKRNGLWDIPKGKIEKGELPEKAAVREIEEECGINNPIIEDELLITYHTYLYKGRPTIKKTFWYSLSYSGSKNLKPQEEEGITKVKWFKFDNIEKIRSKTYLSILDVLNAYFD